MTAPHQAPISGPTEPIFTRPSVRDSAPDRVRSAWASWVGWIVCVAGAISFGVGALIGPASLFGMLVALFAVVAWSPWFRRVARLTPSIELAGLLRLALGVKFLATLPRFMGREDSADYHRVGEFLADSFRSFDFSVSPSGPVPGTGSVQYMTGLVQLVTLEDEFATFVVFSLLGFAGLVLFIQAFITALPGLDPYRYIVLLLFWPTLIYWPSSIGKDSVMVFALAAAALGVAKLLQGQMGGIIWLAVGLGLSALVRPHVALIAVMAAIVALILRSGSGSTSGLVLRIGAIAALVFGGAIASNAVEAVFDIDGLNPTGISAALDMANLRSAQGGSSFVAARIDGPLEFPWGFITVLFRPFPHEATTVPMVLTSIEGLTLAALLLGALPRMTAAIRHLRAEAYVGYAVSFTLVFVYLFSALGNFGILARQRSMTLPLVLLVVALPTARERVRRARMARTG